MEYAFVHKSWTWLLAIYSGLSWLSHHLHAHGIAFDWGVEVKIDLPQMKPLSLVVTCGGGSRRSENTKEWRGKAGACQLCHARSGHLVNDRFCSSRCPFCWAPPSPFVLCGKCLAHELFAYREHLLHLAIIGFGGMCLLAMDIDHHEKESHTRNTALAFSRNDRL